MLLALILLKKISGLPVVNNLVPSMRVDLLLPAGEKIVLVLDEIGADKIRVNSSSLDHPLTTLPDQTIEIVGIEKKVMVGRAMRSAYWLSYDPSGLDYVRHRSTFAHDFRDVAIYLSGRRPKKVYP